MSRAAGWQRPGDPVAGGLQIDTFGGISLQGAVLHPCWMPSPHQRELLGWLVLARWGPPLEVSTVCDAMWPCANGAAAASNFASTVRRLRQAIGDPAAIVVDRGLLSLHPHRCRTDLELLSDGPGDPLSICTSGPAIELAWRLLTTFAGDNPVLQAGSDCHDMAQRIQTVGIAWRQVTRHLCHLLEIAGQTSLALQLCDRIERHGLADDRILEQWQRLALAQRSAR